MSWDKTLPEDSGQISQAPSEIRANWEAIEDTVEVDHYSMGVTDDGKHKKVTLKASTAPTAIADNSILYSKDTAGVSGTKPELYAIDEDSNEMQLTDNGESLANKVSAKSSTDLQIKASSGQDIEVILGDASGSNNITFRSASHTITAITQGNPAQVTATAHGLSTGDTIRLIDVAGMTEINDANYTITKVDDDNFTLDGIDASGYTAYTSGGAFCVEVDKIQSDIPKLSGAYIQSTGTLTTSYGNIASVTSLGSAKYQIFFKTAYSSADDYIVTGNAQLPDIRDRDLTIKERSTTYVTVGIATGTSPAPLPFSVMIMSY